MQQYVYYRVRLKANNGKYVSAQLFMWYDFLVADRDKALDWETFTILHADKSEGEIKNNEQVAFRAFNGQYVSIGVENKLVANQNNIGPLETFTIEIVG